MAISPDDTPHHGADAGRGRARPVLSAATTASTLLAGSAPERVWALSDTEVEDALSTLAQVHACTEALMVAVLAEAKDRGLGSGDGWGPQDWVAMRAPRLSTRTLRDLDTVAAASREPRLAEVVAAVGEGAAPAATEALEIGKAAALVRFHERTRGLADPTSSPTRPGS